MKKTIFIASFLFSCMTFASNSITCKILDTTEPYYSSPSVSISFPANNNSTNELSVIDDPCSPSHHLYSIEIVFSVNNISKEKTTIHYNGYVGSYDVKGTIDHLNQEPNSSTNIDLGNSLVLQCTRN